MSSSFSIKILLLFNIFSILFSIQAPEPAKFIIKGTHNLTLPLKSIANEIQITEGIAKVSIIQEYYNNQKISLETEYYFPINSDAVFDKFEAKIGNKTIKGFIKEKKQAQAEYDENLAKGNTVAYSEIDKNAHDIMRVNVGNIPPYQTVFIKYSYIESLELVLNKLRRFTLYSTLTERYNPDLELPSLNNKEISPSDNTYKWEIYINLTSNKPLNMLYSPSHKILTYNYQNNDQNITIITLKPEESHDPNKDFVLVFQEKDPYDPKIIIERHPIYQNSFVSVINFFPELNSLTNSEATSFLEKRNETNPLLSDIEHSTGEFFFIIDRSGSMDGKRMENLKQALAIFLKSLPHDSYFNVISFGSSFEPLFFESSANISSVRYNKKNLDLALETIKTFEANFGGTEILYPVKKVLEIPVRSEYPKFVFLLTDGDVWNADEVVAMIKHNLNFSRLYTVGIGNGVSSSFIKRMAEVGKGKFEFVKDEDNIEEKTISLLYSATSPYAKNVRISFNNESYVKEMVPKPEKIIMLLKNEMFQFFIFMKEMENIEEIQDFEIYVSYENSFTKKKEEFKLTFDDMKFIDKSDVFHKLAIKKKISILSEDLNDKNNTEIEKIIVQDSVNFQVLSEYTAFITVLDENSNRTNLTQEKIYVDNIKSSDYLDYENSPKVTVSGNSGGSSSGMSFGERNSFLLLGVLLIFFILFLLNN